MRRFYFDLDSGPVFWDRETAIDLSIPQSFDQNQPNHFGAPPAARHAMRSGEFVGNTRKGGSCNVPVITLNPHCNGTHTECIRHVTHHGPHVTDVTPKGPILCAVLTVAPTPAINCTDFYEPKPDNQDLIIDRSRLAQSAENIPLFEADAAIIRTLPNCEDKKNRDYEQTPAPYFSVDAIEFLISHNIDHLLTDLPSIDKAHDQGHMACHRKFWGLPPRSQDDLKANRPWCTVTEMIYVPESVDDGLYLLQLQIPNFTLDVAPSRPLLFPLEF